jgi:hypothetical protein
MTNYTATGLGYYMPITETACPDKPESRDGQIRWSRLPGALLQPAPYAGFFFDREAQTL